MDEKDMIRVYITPLKIAVTHPTAGELVFNPDVYCIELDKPTNVWMIINTESDTTELMIPGEYCKIIKKSTYECRR